MACIKLKSLEEYLQSIDGFERPKLLLEQYLTPAHIAACMLYEIQTKYGDLEGKLVADLGSGSGMLSIGSFLLGAHLTIGFEIDMDAIQIFRTNIKDMEIPGGVECIQCNVINCLTISGSKWLKLFDTVIMNPPFGTKHNAGMDVKFLQIAFQLARVAVYSLHKTTTRDFIKKKALEWNIRAEVIAELRYNIDSTYKFHKKSSQDIYVDCWRFDVTNVNLVVE